MSTPALAADSKVVSRGRLLTKEEAKEPAPKRTAAPPDGSSGGAVFSSRFRVVHSCTFSPWSIRINPGSSWLTISLCPTSRAAILSMSS